jgi:hypothetical protein
MDTVSLFLEIDSLRSAALPLLHRYHRCHRLDATLRCLCCVTTGEQGPRMTAPTFYKPFRSGSKLLALTAVLPTFQTNLQTFSVFKISPACSQGFLMRKSLWTLEVNVHADHGR